MRAVVIEDELNVREGFIKLMNTFCPEIKTVGVASTVEEGIKLISKTEFEILFLDINLPDGSGFDLLYRLPNRNFNVIFITAYDQYAIDAFKISAVDYLLKPISPDLLKKAISKIESHVDQETKLDVLGSKLSKKFDQEEKVILKDAESMQIVVISDIIFCQAEGSYTTFYLTNERTIVTSLNLKEYERILVPYGFIRNHHSFLINLQQVQSIQRSDGGTIVMMDGKKLPLSTRKKSAVIEALKDRFVN